MKKLLFILSLFLTTPAFADDLKIDMLNKRDVGDSITWLTTSKGHNVHFIKAPAGIPFVKSKLNKEFTYKFEKSGIYLYQCTPHKAMGMIGLVVVGNDVSNKDVIAKAKVFGKSKKKLKALLGDL